MLYSNYCFKMIKEKERIAITGENTQEALSFIKSAGFVFGGSFPVLKPDVNVDDAKLREQKFLKSQGIDIEQVRICNSYEEKIIILASLLVSKIAAHAADRHSRLWVIEENPEALLKAARRSMLEQPKIKDFLLSKLTVIKLGTENHSDTKDKKTGIRVVHLTKSEASLPFPMHPTPAS